MNKALSLAFDFLDNWMRNFSHCSMAKMSPGMERISRLTFAFPREQK